MKKLLGVEKVQSQWTAFAQSPPMSKHLKIHIFFLQNCNNLLRIKKLQTKKFSMNLHLNANDFFLALLTIKSRSPHSRVLPYQKDFPLRKCSVLALRPR